MVQELIMFEKTPWDKCCANCRKWAFYCELDGSFRRFCLRNNMTAYKPIEEGKD